jgi:hypothetical protein
MNTTRTGLRRTLGLCVVLAGLAASHSAYSQTITIGNRSFSASFGHPGSTALYVLDWFGDIIAMNPPVSTYTGDAGDWLTPKINIANFQVRSLTNTCLGNGGLNTWLPLSTSRYWYITASNPSPTSVSCSTSIEISAIANPTVILGSATIWLTAYH